MSRNGALVLVGDELTATPGCIVGTVSAPIAAGMGPSVPAISSHIVPA